MRAGDKSSAISTEMTARRLTSRLHCKSTREVRPVGLNASLGREFIELGHSAHRCAFVPRWAGMALRYPPSGCRLRAEEPGAKATYPAGSDAL